MLPGRVGDRKVARGGRRYRRRVQDEGGGIIEERLSLQDGEQPPGQADPSGHRSGGGGVGGPDRCTEYNAIGHDRWPAQWATAATPKAVATTSRTARAPMERASRENPVGEDVTAASKTSSGSSPSNTTSGSSETSGTNGRNPMTNPATTSTTGAGIPTWRRTATATRVTAATQRMMRTWLELTLEY